jgi:signal transduction histidine kinase
LGQALGSDYVTSLFEDAEGSMWVGTRDGLSQLSDVKFPVYSINEGIGDGTGHSVAASKNGGLWIGTGLGLCYFDGSTATNYTDESLIPSHYVKLCFEARSGEVYVEDGERNIDVITSGRLLARLTNSIWTSAIAEDSRSVLVAAGTGDSLFRIEDGKLNHYQYKDGVPRDYYWINDLFVAKDGAIWVASKNGIFRLQDGAVQHWTTTNGLASDNGLWVCQDMDGSMWVGLASGIARIKDGQIKNIKPENGLADSWICTILPDDRGWFWFSSTRGIFRTRRTALNDFADGMIARIECELFDDLSAIKSTGRTDQENSACKTLDGRIWFPCPWGVIMIDPAHIPTNRVAPKVHINRVLANGREFSPAENIFVPPGRGDLQFGFVGLSFISPEKIQFRYQLEGFDSDWVSSEGRHQAFYTNLKPGRYIFRVIAGNADGVWNETGDSLTVELRPRFQQTIGFYCICGGLGLALLVGVYFWRIRHLEFKQRELQASGRRLESEVWKRTAELAERTQSLEKEIEERKRMELEIERVHRVLLETSWQAGMAEVATSVLHNVGNVLNSVNVSATLVLAQMKQSKAPALGKVAALLSEHAANLAGFLTAHPQGRQLPNFLSLLAEQLAREQDNANVELESLRQNIEHIKHIVAMQQNYAKISGVRETVQATDLVEDAVRMIAGALARHEIELVREYADVPPIVVEKHKVLQILVNLISNAKYACDEVKRKGKQLKVMISETAGGVQISIKDNGIGILAENLTRIFGHGFTTREGGHGFGLHSGALAAKELGGSLTVHSDGLGHGATFTLTLPLHPPE